jgi:hypothetical protein
MKIFGYLLVMLVFGCLSAVSAQNMSGTVITKEVKFAKGKHETTVRGSAKYGMSYVFTAGAGAGQTIDLELTGKNPELTFSLMAPPPDEDTIATMVRTYNGELPLKGKYMIVVVNNDEKAGSVPFTLKVKIR